MVGKKDVLMKQAKVLFDSTNVAVHILGERERERESE